jgi:hypothetical protein
MAGPRKMRFFDFRVLTLVSYMVVAGPCAQIVKELEQETDFAHSCMIY